MITNKWSPGEYPTLASFSNNGRNWSTIAFLIHHDERSKNIKKYYAIDIGLFHMNTDSDIIFNDCNKYKFCEIIDVTNINVEFKLKLSIVHNIKSETQTVLEIHTYLYSKHGIKINIEFDHESLNISKADGLHILIDKSKSKLLIDEFNNEEFTNYDSVKEFLLNFAKKEGFTGISRDNAFLGGICFEH